MVSIAKLPGAKPKPLRETDACPKCNRLALTVARGEDYAIGDKVDHFVRCMLCGHRGPLGGLRLVK